MVKEIKVTALPEVHLDIEDLHNFQGELKTMTVESRNKLRRSIIEEGFAMPVAFFENAGIKYILDGHQRLDIMQGLKKEGYEIPKIPCHEIKAKDYNHAKKLLASFISQYGKITKTGFEDFFDGVDFDVKTEFEFPNLEDNFYDDINLSQDDVSSDLDFDDESSEGLTEDDGNFYSKKVEIPVYEAKGEKPEIAEIFDAEKYKRLCSSIDKSSISDNEKIFLKLAAGRHVVFKYDKIAEYYCHSDEEMQGLIEDSALVLIDFNKAIEQGYIRMVDEIQEQYAIDKGLKHEQQEEE